MYDTRIAYARWGPGSHRIIVDVCPFCQGKHHHSLPIGKAQRMAECLQGQYVLDFTSENLSQEILQTMDADVKQKYLEMRQNVTKVDNLLRRQQ